MTRKIFAIGDCHGGYLALLQCLERSKFDYEKDRLICLGDVCDGWPFVRECFDELLKIKNLIYILGNHDEWALEWFSREFKNSMNLESIWVDQGGANTLKSYGVIFERQIIGYGAQWVCVHDAPMPEAHLDILRNAKFYHEENNNIFTHGGILETHPVESTKKDVFLWDRDLLDRVWGIHHYNPNFKIQHYDNIFVGHTTTQSLFRYKGRGILSSEEIIETSTKPLHLCNVWALDTGAGWSGKLTIMNVETKEYWQSDLLTSLYPEIAGRR